MKHLRQYIRKILNEENITLYHRTSPDQAELIKRTGLFDSKIKTQFGTEVYFSNRPDGEGAGYGDALVSVEIPIQYANLDDEFPDGEQHYWVSAKDISRFGRIM